MFLFIYIVFQGMITKCSTCCHSRIELLSLLGHFHIIVLSFHLNSTEPYLKPLEDANSWCTRAIRKPLSNTCFLAIEWSTKLKPLDLMIHFLLEHFHQEFLPQALFEPFTIHPRIFLLPSRTDCPLFGVVQVRCRLGARRVGSLISSLPLPSQKQSPET